MTTAICQVTIPTYTCVHHIPYDYICSWPVITSWLYSIMTAFPNSNTNRLLLPPFRLSTFGHRAMAVNAAARLIYRMRTCDHIIDALNSLHWL